MMKRKFLKARDVVETNGQAAAATKTVAAVQAACTYTAR